jgi:hypothetical protein
MTRKYLLIFASDEHYFNAARRLEAQAKDVGWFDEILVYGPSDRFNGYKPECIRNGFSLDYPRGCGLWAWKPDFILHCLRNCVEERGIVVYLDAGVELNKHGASNFEYYVRVATAGLVVATRTKNIEYFYSNNLLRSALRSGFRDTCSYQYQAGLLVFDNSPRNRALIEKWMTLCLASNGLFLTAKSPAHGYYGENRHDQAVFSALVKKEKIVHSIGLPLSGLPQILSRSRYMKTFPFFSVKNFTTESCVEDVPSIMPDGGWVARLEYVLMKVQGRFRRWLRLA